MPKENHYAIVVGIDQYPRYSMGRKDLSCPQNDAGRVRDWLLSAAGGDLPPGAAAGESPKLKLITRGVPAGRPIPCPLIDEIVEAIDAVAAAFYNKYSLLDEAGQMQTWSTSRLYLFFSGHGIDGEGDDAVLLGANSKENLLFQLSVRDIVNKFKKAKTFREIVVWADCCRTASSIPTIPSALDLTPYRYEGPGDVQVFFARASKTQQPAYEPPKNGLPSDANSFFTRALLEGLSGGVPEATVGITSRNLRSYLEVRVPELSRTYYPVDQHPDIFPDDVITFVSAPTSAKYTARLKVAPGSPFANSAALRIYSGSDRTSSVITPTAPGVFEASLPSGLYTVMPDGGEPPLAEKGFFVRGADTEEEI